VRNPLLANYAFCTGGGADYQLVRKPVIDNWPSGRRVHLGLARLRHTLCDMRTTIFLAVLLVTGVSGDKLLGQAVGDQDASAQDKPHLSSSASEPPQTATIAPVLQDGTPVKLITTRALWSADLCPGDNVSLETAEEVRLGGTLLIAKGSPASGAVTTVQRKRRMARGGEIGLSIDSVRLANGQDAKLRAREDVHGGDRHNLMAAAMIGTAIFYPAVPLWLLMHGRDITIPQGAVITAYVDGNVPLDLASLVAPLPAAPPPSASSGPSPGRVVLEVVTLVPGADVEVDGKLVGSTPSCTHIEPGPHRIKVTRSGYKPEERKINAAAQAIKLNVEIRKKAKSPSR